jgi:hypothetical protein
LAQTSRLLKKMNTPLPLVAAQNRRSTFTVAYNLLGMRKIGGVLRIGIRAVKKFVLDVGPEFL